MALVVFLKGVNVGGHRRFRPSELVKAFERFDVVSVGAAGTFIVRKRVSRARLRSDIARHLPFDATVMICEGRDLLRLVTADPFAGQRTAPDIIHFVSILSKRCSSPPTMPFRIPSTGDWGVRVLACHDRFVVGVHRRQMKAIGQLAQLEKVFGASVTTRSWTTIQTVARVLERESTSDT